MTLRVSLLAECDECGAGVRFEAKIGEVTAFAPTDPRRAPLPPKWKRFVYAGSHREPIVKYACEGCVAIVEREMETHEQIEVPTWTEEAVHSIAFAPQHGHPMPRPERG